MSLEFAIQENTAALNGVMELLKQFMQKEAAPVAAPEKKRKAATAPATAQGDPEGTRYWHIAKHNTVYKQLPGMADCNITDAVEVTETEYQVQKALIEQKVSAPAVPAAPVLQVVPAAPAPVAAPAPAPVAVTYAEVVDAVKQYFRAFGNDAVVSLLSTYGVKRVPELESQPQNFEELVNEIKLKLGE